MDRMGHPSEALEHPGLGHLSIYKTIDGSIRKVRR